MDPGSISLGVAGVIPVIAQAIKAFQILKTRIHTARKCGEKLKDLKFDIEVQEHRLFNECVLLLHASGQSQTDTDQMIKNLGDDRWEDNSLDARLQEKLKRSYNICSRLIERMNNDLQSLIVDLCGFEEVEKVKQKVSKIVFRGYESTDEKSALQDENWKTVYDHVREKIKFSFDKPLFEKKIDVLRKRNEDLESMCTQLERASNSSTSVCPSRRALPSRFSKVQQVSEEAYRALSANFSCGDKSHGEHSASLCLDVEIVENIYLSMSIVCKTNAA